MLKKIFWTTLFCLIISTIVVVSCRTSVFPTTVKLIFDGDYSNAVCSATVVTQNNKTYKIERACSNNFKIKAPYNSKIKISINAPTGISINETRIGNYYPQTKEFNNFFTVDKSKIIQTDKKIIISSAKKSFDISLKDKTPLQCKQIKFIFDQPYEVILVSPIIFAAFILGIFYLLKFLTIYTIKIYKFCNSQIAQFIELHYTNSNNEAKDKLLIKCLQMASIALFCVVIFFQIIRIAIPQFEYDSSYNATIAKNMSLGYGPSSSYDGIKMFNPEVTTGLTLILPVALGIKVFSNTPWVPNAICSLINIILLLVILYLPRNFNFIDKKKLWIWRALFLAFIVMSFSLESNLMVFHSEFSAVLGEFPAVLLIIISAITLILSENRKSMYFLAGLIGGLAFATKTMALISVIPIFFTYLLLTCKKWSDLKSKVFPIISFFIGFFAPYLLTEIYKYIEMGSVFKYLELKAQEHEFFVTSGSGVQSHYNVFYKFYLNSQILISKLGFLRYFILLGFPAICMFKLFFIKRLNLNKSVLLMSVLMCAAFVNIGWWLFCSMGWIRHFSIGWMLFLTALSASVFYIDTKNKYIYSLIILLFLTIPSSINVDKSFVKFNALNNHKLQAQNEAVKFISTHNEYKYYGCNWWANRDLEYALPKVNNFSNCMDSKNFNNKIHNKALVRTMGYWNWENNPAATALKNKCEKNILFKNNYYIISSCDAR